MQRIKSSESRLLLKGPWILTYPNLLHCRPRCIQEKSPRESRPPIKANQSAVVVAAENCVETQVGILGNRYGLWASSIASP